MIRGVLRWVLAAFYAAAGYLHLVRPEPFLSIMPSWVPAPEAVVLWIGVAELLGAAALVQWASPRLRRAGAIGLAAYAVCVFPISIISRSIWRAAMAGSASAITCRGCSRSRCWCGWRCGPAA
jgi:uncharacterized membrane protein